MFGYSGLHPRRTETRVMLPTGQRMPKTVSKSLRVGERHGTDFLSQLSEGNNSVDTLILDC